MYKGWRHFHTWRGHYVIRYWYDCPCSKELVPYSFIPKPVPQEYPEDAAQGS